MTISALFDLGHDRIRLPIWGSPTCYLKLDRIQPGTYGNAAVLRGPWVHLYDRPVQKAIGVDTPQNMIVIDLGDDDTWVPYEGPLDNTDGPK